MKKRVNKDAREWGHTNAMGWGLTYVLLVIPVAIVSAALWGWLWIFSPSALALVILVCMWRDSTKWESK